MAEPTLSSVSNANNIKPLQQATRSASSNNFTDIQSPKSKAPSTDGVTQATELSNNQIKGLVIRHNTHKPNILVEIGDDKDLLSRLEDLDNKQEVDKAEVQEIDSKIGEDFENIQLFQKWYQSNDGSFTLEQLKAAISSIENLKQIPESVSEATKAGVRIEELTNATTKFIEDFKSFMTDNLTKALAKAEEKLSQAGTEAEKAKIKEKIDEIQKAQEQIKQIENMQNKSPAEILAALKGNDVLEKTLKVFLKDAIKDEKTGELSLSKEAKQKLNLDLFGIVFKDEKQRSAIADILYEYNPTRALFEFFGKESAKDLLKSISDREKAETKKQEEEHKSEQKQEERAEVRQNAARRTEAREAEAKKQEEIQKRIRSQDPRAQAAYRSGNYSINGLLAHGYDLVNILNEINTGGLAGLALEARQKVCQILATKGITTNGSESITTLIEKLTASSHSNYQTSTGHP